MAQPETMYHLLVRQAGARPDAEAVRYGDQSWTWAQLAERVARGAAAQLAAGLRPGDRVALLDLNHPSWVEINLACAQIGTTNVLVNSRLAPAEIEYVLNDAGAEVLFAGAEVAGALASLQPSVRDRIPTLRRVVRIGGDSDEYESWLEVEPTDKAHRADSEHGVLQLYTSGTTGRPKGVVLTDRSLRAICLNMGSRMEWRTGDSALFATPMFHIASVVLFATSMAAGARMVVLHRRNGDQGGVSGRGMEARSLSAIKRRTFAGASSGSMPVTGQ